MSEDTDVNFSFQYGTFNNLSSLIILVLNFVYITQH